MIRRFALALLFALIAASVQAQESMALRFNIVPKQGTGFITDPLRPKYIADLGVPYAAMDYGLEDTMLVGANLTSLQETTLAANIDVIAIPANLDNAIGLAGLTPVQSALESLHVPAGWVTVDHTYRQVVSAVGKIFQFMQRYHALFGTKFFLNGVTLDSRINQLTTLQQNALNTTAQSLGLATASITGPTLIRAAFKSLADQMAGFTLAGQTF